MAANFIIGDESTRVFRDIVRYGQMLREGVDGLRQVSDIMVQMRDGDGSSAAHYDLLTAQAGYGAGDYSTADDAAKASFDELASLLAKVNSNDAVSNVRAAIDQFCAKHGIN